MSSMNTGTLSDLLTFATPEPRIIPSCSRGSINTVYMDGFGFDNNPKVQVGKGSRHPQCRLPPGAMNVPFVLSLQ